MPLTNENFKVDFIDKKREAFLFFQTLLFLGIQATAINEIINSINTGEAYFHHIIRMSSITCIFLLNCLISRAPSNETHTTGKELIKCFAVIVTIVTLSETSYKKPTGSGVSSDMLYLLEQLFILFVGIMAMNIQWIQMVGLFSMFFYIGIRAEFLEFGAIESFRFYFLSFAVAVYIHMSNFREMQSQREIEKHFELCKFYESLLNLFPEGVVILGDRERLQYANESAKKMFSKNSDAHLINKLLNLENLNEKYFQNPNLKRRLIGSSISLNQSGKKNDGGDITDKFVNFSDLEEDREEKISFTDRSFTMKLNREQLEEINIKPNFHRAGSSSPRLQNKSDKNISRQGSENKRDSNVTTDLKNFDKKTSIGNFQNMLRMFNSLNFDSQKPKHKVNFDMSKKTLKEKYVTSMHKTLKNIIEYFFNRAPQEKETRSSPPSNTYSINSKSLVQKSAGLYSSKAMVSSLRKEDSKMKSSVNGIDKAYEDSKLTGERNAFNSNFSIIMYTVVPKSNYYSEIEDIDIELKIIPTILNGKPSILIFIRNLRERQKLLEMYEKNQYMSTLMASVSHELRTPLNGILGMLEALKTQISDELAEAFLSPAVSNGKILLNLINDILDYSQIKEGKMSLVLIDFDLKKILAEALNLLALQAKRRGLSLCLAFDKFIPKKFVSDPNRVRQIVINLLGKKQ
jgi:PAS domain-containing protein